ncbi:MAG TPA: class I SAM-dependent methyltransferase [Malonomonas sp.]
MYKKAAGDINRVIWSDLVANPCLVKWLAQRSTIGKRAIVVGCGLGDDVAYLAAEGFDVLGFDVSTTAVEMCKKRYPEIDACFQVADLLNMPTDWMGNYDLVFECNTIQALSGSWRVKALNAIADLVAPAGVVLVSCRGRNSGEKEDAFPLPLDHAEIAGFERAGLKQLSFDCYDDEQIPPVPHFFASYQRPT